MSSPSVPQTQAPPDHYAEEQARQAAERADREKRAGEARTGATTQARSDAEAEAVRRGLNPADYQSLIDREISKTLGLIPSDDLNPGTYFQNFGSNIFNSEESAQRNAAQGRVNAIAPTGFDRIRTPDSIVDPVIGDIIGGQYNEAVRGLDAARARGTLVDSGYSGAMGSLNERRAGARAKFDPIVSSVLEGTRGAQRDVADTYRQRAAGLNLGQTFDEAGFTNALNETEAREEAALGGRIRSLAPNNLFDIGELINFGGARQGAQNAPVVNATPRDQQRDKKRGLGTTGAF